MAPDNAPDQFEWVSAQAECTAPSIFERLRAGVRQDVEHRNAQVGLDDGIRFEFSEDGDVFDVARLEGSRFTDPRVAALVRFERAGRRINVHSEDVDVNFTAVLTLDPAGSSSARPCMWSGRSGGWRSSSCSSASPKRRSDLAFEGECARGRVAANEYAPRRPKWWVNLAVAEWVAKPREPR